jgi:sulfide:quinone oxidoreductase
MSAPSFLKGQPISDASGFVQVGADMRHIKYPNIWALGDCTNLPNAKTAAAVFSQAPTLVFNLTSSLNKQQKRTVNYDGYSACPIFLGGKKLMLAEFRIFNEPNKTESTTEIDESFHPKSQTIPRYFYYYVTKSFFFWYNIALKGRWYGKHCVIYPFNKDGSARDYRHFYKYIVPASAGFFSFIAFLYLL